MHFSEQLADESLEGKEKAMLDLIFPLFKDAGKLKDWISSKCSTATVEGDNVQMYWSMGDTGSNDMPNSMAVCQVSDEKMRTMATYGHTIHCYEHRLDLVLVQIELLMVGLGLIT